jgi:dipeptidase
MCDTLVALSDSTRYDCGLFAKNSDRPPNEAQYLDWLPGGSFAEGESLKCTYIEVTQIPKTHPVLLSRPFWMWGGEMGVNQYGLAIGNESVFSKIPSNKEPALLGMDLLRLGLERARTATEAVEVITSLLERYGQGGNCVQEGHLYYHNSFLIADPRESWVLETIDRHWAARQVSPVYSISNLLLLDSRWDLSSPGLEDYAISKGFTRPGRKTDLAADFSDLIYTTFADGRRRCDRSRDLLSQSGGEIAVQDLAAILRDHRNKKDPRPGLGGADICMHASLGPIRISQTTGSMIALLDEGNPLVFATGTAAPCTGIFKPFWVDATPEMGKLPDSRYDPETLYWSHERLHRELVQNYPDRLASYQEERDSLEGEFIQGALTLRDAEATERKAYSEDCLVRAAQAEQRWLEGVRKIPQRNQFLHHLAWGRFNKRARWAQD